MRLALKPVTAIQSRGEVFFTRGKRRKGQLSGPEFSIVRVPKMPPLCPSAENLFGLQRELGLRDRTCACALGLRLETWLALKRGELIVAEPHLWAEAAEALHAAAAQPEPEGW